MEYRDRRRWAAIPSLSPFTGCTRPAADCKVPNPTTNAYQDIKFVDGRLVASGLFPGRTGAIDWLDYPSLRLIRRVTVGQTSRGVPYTSEGMAIRGDRILLLPEDSPSRLFQFDFVAPAFQVKK